MKILSVHAHFDDFEFVAGGTFELWRQKLGPELQAKILVCTDGRAGHHRRTREETGRVRLEEQRASAKIGQYAFENLTLPDGTVPREACLEINAPFLAALWKSIRDFEPDYLFCPPYPTDPRAGVHIDHWMVAEAVRKVAYMINVPHAFTPEYPADETQSEEKKVPVILNVYDSYMHGSNSYDFSVNIDPAFDRVCEMLYCHQSQIVEWIPWVGRHQMKAPKDLLEWKRMMREIYFRRNRELGLNADYPAEVFAITSWGEVPTRERLEREIPSIRFK